MPKKPPAKKSAAALERYHGKRDFSKTSEPTTGNKSERGRIFVIQEHHARAHHFDFRLELDGVLLSWAVPKGIPDDPAEKRLAVHVEDHPIDYAKFSGVIPKGNYGAGTVAIWDEGTWEPIQSNWRKALEKGKIEFTLSGKRLNGAYVLIRMKEPNWLLRRVETHASTPSKLPDEEAAFISPQLAKVVASVPQGDEWIHEIKLDGYRLIAVRNSGKVRLFTRSSLDWTDKFAALAKHLEKLPSGDFVLDGEAVVFDEKGRTRFGKLQEALKSTGNDIAFVAFDLLNKDGKSLRALPLGERLTLLEKLIPSGSDGAVRLSRTWPAKKGADLFKQACKLELEGIISKKKSARYYEGERKDWAKSKCRPRQEFVVCGYTDPKNSCPAFGALVLGSYEGKKLVPRGKVGTGFTDDARVKLLDMMKPLVTKRAPFEFAESGIHWIQPKLVAEIEFAEITSEGSIRQGSFMSIREDKPASDVHLDGVQKATSDPKKLTVAGIPISHPDRVVYPQDGITKIEVANYYDRIQDLIVPYVKNRPLAIIRAPDGIGGDMFFQKNFKTHLPDHVYRKQIGDSDIFYIKDGKGLVALAQFGAIEIHPWGANLTDVDKPDQLIWDLDPDTEVSWKEVLGTAFLLKDFLAERKLQTVIKTSGGKGLHVILPLRRSYDWDVMKPFSKAVATAVAAFNPKKLLVNSSLKKRSGKIYIDFLRNGKGATCIAPWGLRARVGATVSTPLNWEDLADLGPAGFTINEPFSLPDDWKKIKPQTITKAHLNEFSLA